METASGAIAATRSLSLLLINSASKMSVLEMQCRPVVKRFDYHPLQQSQHPGLPDGGNRPGHEGREFLADSPPHLLQPGRFMPTQLVSTLAYCLYLTALVCVQIYSGWVLVRVMEGPNLVFTGKVSLLTLSVCNI